MLCDIFGLLFVDNYLDFSVRLFIDCAFWCVRIWHLIVCYLFYCGWFIVFVYWLISVVWFSLVMWLFKCCCCFSGGYGLECLLCLVCFGVIYGLLFDFVFL